MLAHCRVPRIRKWTGLSCTKASDIIFISTKVLHGRSVRKSNFSGRSRTFGQRGALDFVGTELSIN